MATQDSIYLLRECDAGVKMAMASLDLSLIHISEPTRPY